MKCTVLARCAATLATALPVTAIAHAGHEHTPDQHLLAAFASGFSHPFTGMDHLVAMVALGVWSAVATRTVWAAPLAFALTLLLGAVLGLAGLSVPAIEPMIVGSLLVIGLLLVSGRQLPVAAGVVIAAVFALFHGAAHGQELSGSNALGTLAGMVLATVILHVGGLAAGTRLRQHPIGARAVGALVTLCGLGLAAPIA